MEKNRRHLTLIMLRPDGRNWTWAFTRRKFMLFSAGAVLFVIVVAVLIYTAILQRIEYRRLWDKYQLMAGREIVAVSPQPSPVDQIPGAAQLPDEIAGAPSALTPGEPAGQQPVRPGSEDIPVQRTVTPGRERQAVEPIVRLDDFSLLPLNETEGWVLDVQLTKTEWTGEVQRGFIAILIQDAERPGRYLTLPPMTVVNDRPLSPQAGESFAIRRLKPIRHEFSLPEGFRMREVQILVYDREGELLLERVFPVEGGS